MIGQLYAHEGAYKLTPTYVHIFPHLSRGRTMGSHRLAAQSHRYPDASTVWLGCLLDVAVTVGVFVPFKRGSGRQTAGLGQHGHLFTVFRKEKKREEEEEGKKEGKQKKKKNFRLPVRQRGCQRP